ncbi:MAG: 8-amino-7-oxononanoate synthase [Planctomycetaceae bacterium]|nr:8-amino-7-oxononanoate synthase [Planctomycetaceae bacterium]
MDVWLDMRKMLEDLAANNLLRRAVILDSAAGPRISVAGRTLLCLCSNDYLGLANDPAVRAAAQEALQRWGVGTGASRLVSGTTALHVQLEERLAAFKGVAGALVTSTGWMANHVAVHALAGPGDLVLCDKLNHASILDAARSSGATMRCYLHADLDRLEGLLKKHRGGHGRCLIATDSLFSMDGDLAPLAQLVELKVRYDAQLLVDEAHATGVIGPRGRGVAEALGVEEHVDATVGTLSKALGAMGGFVAGRAELIDTIRNTGRAYIYTTALPAMICAAAIAALDIVESQPQRRTTLLALGGQLRSGLAAMGIDTGQSASQICPVMIGSAARALTVSAGLMERGFFVVAIRPPTVPRGTSRLRISLSTAHSAQDVSGLIEAIGAVTAGSAVLP